MTERKYVLDIDGYERGYKSLARAREVYDVVEGVFRRKGLPLPTMVIRSEAIFRGK